MAYLLPMSRKDFTPAFTQPTTSTVSARIRAQRKSRRLTLHDIERLSEGRIKAVVMGSYERGTRAISLARTIEIANLFGIPVAELIDPREQFRNLPNFELVFDLRKISEIEVLQDLSTIGSDIQNLTRYLKSISILRRDWNGEVLSLRKNDFDTLALLTGKSREQLLDFWLKENLLLKAPNHL